MRRRSVLRRTQTLIKESIWIYRGVGSNGSLWVCVLGRSVLRTDWKSRLCWGVSNEACSVRNIDIFEVLFDVFSLEFGSQSLATKIRRHWTILYLYCS